jgi:arylsulfatase
MVFTQHYSGAPVCAPARYSLITGKHMGHSYIRGNDEWRERGEVWDYVKAFSDTSLEGQRPIPENTVTIGKLLQKAGYTTGMFGKWGLGAPETVGVPNLQGFDTFYGYNCQRQAHNLYPSHLWENETKVFLENDLISTTTKLNHFLEKPLSHSPKDETGRDCEPAFGNYIHKKYQNLEDLGLQQFRELLVPIFQTFLLYSQLFAVIFR